MTERQKLYDTRYKLSFALSYYKLFLFSTKRIVATNRQARRLSYANKVESLLITYAILIYSNSYFF